MLWLCHTGKLVAFIKELVPGATFQLTAHRAADDAKMLMYTSAFLLWYTTGAPFGSPLDAKLVFQYLERSRLYARCVGRDWSRFDTSGLPSGPDWAAPETSALKHGTSTATATARATYVPTAAALTSAAVEAAQPAAAAPVTVALAAVGRRKQTPRTGLPRRLSRLQLRGGVSAAAGSASGVAAEEQAEWLRVLDRSGGRVARGKGTWAHQQPIFSKMQRVRSSAGGAPAKRRRRPLGDVTNVVFAADESAAGEGDEGSK